MKYTTAAIAIASFSAAATPAAASSSSSSTSKSGKSGVGGDVCTAADFTGAWKGGRFCASVTSFANETETGVSNAAVNEVFNGCHIMPRSAEEGVYVQGTAWELAAQIEAADDKTLQFRTLQVYSDPCVSYFDNLLYVNGFWAEDCTFMATVGSTFGTISSPSNTYIGRLDKTTNELVFGYSNYEGVNRKFLTFFDDVEGTMNARLTYFGTDTSFCPL